MVDWYLRRGVIRTAPVWPKSDKCGMRIQQGEQDVAEAQFDLKERARSMPGASRQFPSDEPDSEIRIANSCRDRQQFGRIGIARTSSILAHDHLFVRARN
jgi:hypothetical protein